MLIMAACLVDDPNEKDKITVSEIGAKLYLNTNTLTPLLNKIKDSGV